MIEWHLLLLLCALVLDWYLGEPKQLWSRIPHPVVMIGWAVGLADRVLNRRKLDPKRLEKRGGLAISGLVIASIVAGNFLLGVFSWIAPLGWIPELFVVFVLLAQKSLGDHVAGVAVALEEKGVEGGREAVSLIVSRNTENLDSSAVSRAAIESLAENFSDGIVAPAFWYVVMGLPGLLAYKMINTADSMIGHKNEKYLHFGKWAAIIDDFANWVPARLSVVPIAVAAFVSGTFEDAKAAFTTASRDASLHASPNAGWPEAAFAGALGISLGGPRSYGDKTLKLPRLNDGGKRRLGRKDINAALDLFAKSCFSLWGLVLVVLAFML